MSNAAAADHEFPRPPKTFSDHDGRTVTIDAYDGNIDPLVEMYVDFGPESRSQGVPPRTEAEISDWLSGLLESGLNVAVWHDGQPVGHAVLVPYEDTSELAIFVHPAYQHAGIGSQLISVLLGNGQENDLDTVWLSVSRSNHVARRLYEAVGFDTMMRDRVELEMERSL